MGVVNKVRAGFLVRLRVPLLGLCLVFAVLFAFCHSAGVHRSGPSIASFASGSAMELMNVVLLLVVYAAFLGCLLAMLVRWSLGEVVAVIEGMGGEAESCADTVTRNERPGL